MRIFIIWLLLAGSAFANSYSTSFPTGEMTGGNWVQGKTVGVDWCNVVNTPGFAFGTQTGSQKYDDSTAVVAGNWGSDQSAQATVSVPRPGSQTAEVELRLRTAITPGRITGYEFNSSVAGNAAYMQIVRWNGALNNFTQISGAATQVHSGDVIMATAVGNRLTLYRNGSAVCSASDSTFPSGSPGIGFYSQQATINQSFGFSSFSASDNGLAPIPTPTPAPTPIPTAYAAWEASLLSEMQAAGIQQFRINTVQTWLSSNPPKP